MSFLQMWEYKGKVIKLRLEDIYFFCAEERKIYIHTENRIYQIGGTLKAEVDKAKGHSFIHTHQAYFVNLQHLECIGRGEAVLSNGVKVPVSERKESDAKMGMRQYASHLKKVQTVCKLTKKRCNYPMCLRMKSECGMVTV